MSSLPRSSGNPYVASITSPSTTSYPNRGRRPSNYSSYGFPSTPSTFSNAGGGSNNAYGNPYSGAYSSGSFSERGSARRFNLGRLIKRLLKFPQMDFEIAGWEMLNLMVAPKKVWRQVWYRKRESLRPVFHSHARRYVHLHTPLRKHRISLHSIERDAPNELSRGRKHRCERARS